MMRFHIPRLLELQKTLQIISFIHSFVHLFIQQGLLGQKLNI